jgi:hypothetical protein
MSAQLNQAILTALRGNSALCAQLSIQASGQPAIFYGHKSQSPPIYAQVTFEQSTDNPAPGFWPGWMNKEEDYDISIWTNLQGSDIIPHIHLEIARTLHQVQLYLPDPTTNYCYWMRWIAGGRASTYDHTLKAFFGLYRYRAWTAGI